MFFPDEPKVGVKTIKQYAQMMKDENVNRAILVVQVNLTPHARQSLVEVQSRFLLEQVRRAITTTSHPLSLLPPCVFRAESPQRFFKAYCYGTGVVTSRGKARDAPETPPLYAAMVHGESIMSSEARPTREYCVLGHCCLAWLLD